MAGDRGADEVGLLYAAPNGPPTLLVHKDCGGEVNDRRRCARCGDELEAWDVVPVRGPGADDRRLPSLPAPEPLSELILHQRR